MLYRILRVPYIIYETCLKYNILQSSLQEILKWNHYFTKNKKNSNMNNKTFKHCNTQNDTHDSA